MLQDDKNNYIASIFIKGNTAGLCFADVSTGTAHITELRQEKVVPAVITELCRYHPSEVLMNPNTLDCRELTTYLKKICSVPSNLSKRNAMRRALWPSRWKISSAATGPRRPASTKGQCPLCHGGVAGISARYPDQGRRTPEDRHQLQQGAVHEAVAGHAGQSGTDRDAARPREAGAPCSGCWTRPAPPWASGCSAAGSNSRSFPAASSTAA